jgi:hypothetical protein
MELLLEAERALSYGLVDRAEQLYRQVATGDPRNSIAVVGLARVALERADDLGAYMLARRALGIDPENEAARRLAVRLEEVLATRGQPVGHPLPEELATPRPSSTQAGAQPVMPGPPAPQRAAPPAGATSATPPPATPSPPPPDPAAYRPKRSLIDRLRRRDR